MSGSKMTTEQFKKLVASKGSQAYVAEKTGYGLRTIEALCSGERTLLDRHIKAVKAVRKK